MTANKMKINTNLLIFANSIVKYRLKKSHYDTVQLKRTRATVLLLLISGSSLKSSNSIFK